MIRLIACSNCHRQFDGSDLAVGDKFRCHCGQTVEVLRSESHEAAVVRCSSCGGARRAGAMSCEFCQADFTVHEQDLHTICPECFTRISDKAKYCHSCGVHIAPVGSAGHSAKLSCPACEQDRPLYDRVVEDKKIHFFECHICAGFWLGIEAFRGLASSARNESLPPELTSVGAPKLDGPSVMNKGRMYRQCPSCEKWMHRKNFGNRSGVIIDICPGHGIWLDNGELNRILQWIKDGGETHASQKAKEEKQRAEARKQSSFHQQKINRMAGNPPRTGDPFGQGTEPKLASMVLSDSLVEVVFEALSRLFNR